MIRENKVLFISKITKLELLQRKYNKSIQFIKKYLKNKDPRLYENLIFRYIEHVKCLELVKKYFPKALFIYPWNLTKKLTSNYDLIVSIGGDENFKYVIHHSRLDKIFLSICSNYHHSECRLSMYNIHTLDQMVDDIMMDNLNIEKWNLNKIELYRSQKYKDFYEESWSMDTIYIGSRLSCDISKYKIVYNSNLEIQKSSGILISTSMGSTGWFNAASGKSFCSNFNNHSEFFVREIYKGKTRYSNTKIENGIIDFSNNLEIHSLMDKGIINIDWTKEYKFNRSKIVKITLSSTKALKVVYKSKT